MIRKVNLKFDDELLVLCDSGNEYLIKEVKSNGRGLILSTEKQPAEIWKTKKPRWPNKNEIEEYKND